MSEKFCCFQTIFLAKLALCVVTMGIMYALILFVLQLDAAVQEFRATAPWLLWATAALGLVLFFVYDLALSRLTAVYRVRRRRKSADK